MTRTWWRWSRRLWSTWPRRILLGSAVALVLALITGVLQLSDPGPDDDGGCKAWTDPPGVQVLIHTPWGDAVHQFRKPKPDGFCAY